MNIAAITYEIRKTMTNGTTGLLILSLNTDVIKKYPITELPTEIVTLPRKLIRVPMPLVITNEPLFFNANTKPVIADEQKFLPVKATWMQAFLFRNLMNRWQQSRQHLVAQLMHLTAELSPLNDCNFLSKYSNINRKTHTIPRMNEPRANEPKLYLKAHQIPFKRLKFPCDS